MALTSGGETTVTIGPDIEPGPGGRNRHYALAAACFAAEVGLPIYGAAWDTDGIGGDAGARIFPDTEIRARQKGLSPDEMLKRRCSGDFFRELEDQIHTGPLQSNVGDIRVLFVDVEEDPAQHLHVAE